jgi:hypothetical protein
MHVFHTAGVPPRDGRTIFENMGCTAKSSAAFRKTVAVNVAATRRGRVDPSGKPAGLVASEAAGKDDPAT